MKNSAWERNVSELISPGEEEIIFVTRKGCFFIGIFLPKLLGIHQNHNSLISADTMFHFLVAI